MTKSLVIISLLVASCTVEGSPARGGANYFYYQMDSGCYIEPYGVIYNYNTATSTINSQLQTMYNNGLRRFRLPIFFGHGINCT